MTRRDIDVGDDPGMNVEKRERADRATRRATVRTTHDCADTIAAAVRPDNTPQMNTRVEDGTVVTTIERETTGGLQSTVDDYVVNLSVAADVVETVRDRKHHERGGRSDRVEDYPADEPHTQTTESESEHESETESNEHT